MSDSVNIRRMASIALIGALIFVLTAIPRIPVPATGGYVHLGDAGVAFAAYAFGPWVAMFAGGIGTAMADMLGFPQWALFSLLVHGFQGFVMGMIVKKTMNVWTMILSVVAGAVIVVGGYFVAGTILEGAAVATLELIPNTIQGLSGGLIGMPLYLAVRKAYPPLEQFRRSA